MIKTTAPAAYCGTIRAAVCRAQRLPGSALAAPLVTTLALVVSDRTETARGHGTGIGYFAKCSLDVPHLRARGTSIHVYQPPESVAERRWLLGDLFDTLDIDARDAATRWNLLRQDDNGNKFLVDSFTGYAKAAARLVQFGAGHHKQICWLEEVAGD